MQDLTNHYNAQWQGWKYLVDGHEIGRIESDLADGYSLHFNESNPPIAWTATTATSATEAMELMQDYWHALTDLVELGEADYVGSGKIEAVPVNLWEELTA